MVPSFKLFVFCLFAMLFNIIYAQMECDIDIHPITIPEKLARFWAGFRPGLLSQKIQWTSPPGQSIWCTLLDGQEKVTRELFIPLSGLPEKSSLQTNNVIAMLQLFTNDHKAALNILSATWWKPKGYDTHDRLQTTCRNCAQVYEHLMAKPMWSI